MRIGSQSYLLELKPCKELAGIRRVASQSYLLELKLAKKQKEWAELGLSIVPVGIETRGVRVGSGEDYPLNRTCWN